MINLTCTICDISNIIDEKGKKLSKFKRFIISRKLYERVKKLEKDSNQDYFSECYKAKIADGISKENALKICKAIVAKKDMGTEKSETSTKKEAFAKAPAGEGSRFKACVKKMMDDGKSEDSANKICASIGRKKYGSSGYGKLIAKGKSESSASKEINSMPIITLNTPVSNPILIDYKQMFEQMLKLKLQPINNYMDYEKVDRQLWKLKDKLYELERKYIDSGVSILPDEDIMITKIQVQKEVLPEINNNFENTRVKSHTSTSKSGKSYVVKEHERSTKGKTIDYQKSVTRSKNIQTNITSINNKIRGLKDIKNKLNSEYDKISFEINDEIVKKQKKKPYSQAKIDKIRNRMKVIDNETNSIDNKISDLRWKANDLIVKKKKMLNK